MIRLGIWAVIGVVACVFVSWMGWDIPASAAPASSCQPPAQSWATLVACKTATAAGVQTVATSETTRTPQPTFTPVLIPSATSVPTATWTPQPTPPDLLIDSEGYPYTCDSLTPAPWLLLRPDGTWRGCVRVATLPAPTRIVP